MKTLAQQINEDFNNSTVDEVILEILHSNKKLSKLLELSRRNPLELMKGQYITDINPDYNMRDRSRSARISLQGQEYNVILMFRLEHDSTSATDNYSLTASYHVSTPKNKNGHGLYPGKNNVLDVLEKYTDSHQYMAEYSEFHPNFVKSANAIFSRITTLTGAKITVDNFGFVVK